MLTLGLLTQQDSNSYLPDSWPLLIVPGLGWFSSRRELERNETDFLVPLAEDRCALAKASVCECTGTRDGLGGVALQEVALKALILL
jgi:hypothetical protein